MRGARNRSIPTLKPAQGGKVVIMTGKRATAVLPDRDVDLGECTDYDRVVIFRADTPQGRCSMRERSAGTKLRVGSLVPRMIGRTVLGTCHSQCALLSSDAKTTTAVPCIC